MGTLASRNAFSDMHSSFQHGRGDTVLHGVRSEDK